MNILENAFVILHIKISSWKFWKFSGRSMFTLALIFLVAFGALQLFLSVTSDGDQNFLDILGSVVYLLFVLFATGSWIRAWTVADKMLNKAGDYEKEQEEKKQKEFSKNYY
jgi:hypothetical protein